MKVLDVNYKYVVENVAGIIIGCDSSGCILYANEQAMSAFQYGDEIVGTGIQTIFPLIFKEVESVSGLASYLSTYYGEISAYRKNGTCFPVALQVKLDEENGIYWLKVINRQAYIQLAKQLDNAEQESKDVKTMQNEFVANVTHELRTPVNGIKGHVAYLLEQQNLNHEQEDTLNIILKCCSNMEQIINNLLDYAKIEAGKFTIECNRFSFREMMNLTRDTHSKNAIKKGLSLNVHIDESIPDVVYGDSLRIGQILNNLLSNAIKFTSVGSVSVDVVKVAERENELELFFMVKDTGIGISPEESKKLFRSFSQVDGSITRKYGGTGLGLAICKQLVEMMNGSIKVQSEKGHGSTFAFSIVLYTSEDKKYVKREVSSDGPETFKNAMEAVQNKFDNLLKQMGDTSVNDSVVWGSASNKEELKDTLGKLLLCIDMRSWEKAEMFMSKLQTLTDGGGMEVKKNVFKLLLSIRKENYDACMETFKAIKDICAQQ